MPFGKNESFLFCLVVFNYTAQHIQ